MARKPGTPNRATLLRRENFLSCIEVCRACKVSPPQLLAEAMEVIRTLALKPLRGTPKMTPQQRRDLIDSLTEQQKDRIIRRLAEASKIGYMLMDFSYPRMARIETIGDAPTIVQNNFDVTLAADERGIWERQQPEIEVIEDLGPTNGGGSGTTH